jgi:hypothetical protein
MEDFSDITQEKRPEYLTFGVNVEKKKWLKYSSWQLLRPSTIAVLVFCFSLLLLRPSVYRFGFVSRCV